MTLLLVIPALLTAASAAAMAYALRGRRVDDHPVCRKCGFDLFGKPADATRCSECGAELSRRRAVRVGRRETRRGLVKLMALLMLVSLGLFGVQGWGKARGVDWNRQKPAWWLEREAGSADAATRDAALAEIVRRIGDGTLPREREEALVQKALAHQADWNQPWVPAWGAVVEAVQKAGRLSGERWDQYATLAVPFTLVPAQPAYRRAHDVGFNLLPGPRRQAAPRQAARPSVALPKARTYATDLYVNEVLVTNDQAHRATLPRQAGVPPLPGIMPFAVAPRRPGEATLWTRFDEATARRLGDGRQVTRMSLVLAPLPFERPSSTLPVGTITRALEAAWALLPDASIDDDFEVRLAAREAISVREVRHGYDTRRGRQSKGRLACDVFCHAPPVDLVYNASFRWLAVDDEGTMRYSGEPTVLKDPVHFRKGVRGQRVPLEVNDARPLGAPPPRWAEVVFTPWPQAAPVGVDVIGGGEIVFHNVPVRMLWTHSGAP